MTTIENVILKFKSMIKKLNVTATGLKPTTTWFVNEHSTILPSNSVKSYILCCCYFEQVHFFHFLLYIILYANYFFIILQPHLSKYTYISYLFSYTRKESIGMIVKDSHSLSSSGTFKLRKLV